MLILDTKKTGWKTMPDDAFYKGDISTETGLPHGFGILTFDNRLFYVGELRHGQRHGRGFMLWYDMGEMKSRATNYTYKQVLDTTEIDSNGHVCEIGPDGAVAPEQRAVRRWVKERDGLWEADSFVSETDTKALGRAPWNGYVLESREFMPDNLKFGPYQAPLTAVAADGKLLLNGADHYVTPYDDRHLLVLTRAAMVVVVPIDGEATKEETDRLGNVRRYVYALRRA